ncbi:MAG: DegT/DnrJ/EryC1/StrS family aminotransferase, partial [Polaribacter sp.]
SVQAAILKLKLPHLNDYCDARRNAARAYTRALKHHPNIITPTTKSNATAACSEICNQCDCHVFHQYTLQITNGKRDELHKHLLENGIPNAIYYPVALHNQKAYRDERYHEDDFPVTNDLTKKVISLPMHTELDNEQLEFICNTILSFMNEE